VPIGYHPLAAALENKRTDIRSVDGAVEHLNFDQLLDNSHIKNEVFSGPDTTDSHLYFIPPIDAVKPTE
jgi:hypothetical protein